MIDNGYESVLVDTRVDDFNFSNIDYNEYICVAISAIAGPILASALDIAKTIREKRPNIKLIWGGPLSTLEPDMVIKNKYVDIAVLGDAELTFLKLVQKIESNKPIDDVPNILFKKDGKVMKNPIEPENFNRLNHLPYDLLDFKKYPNTLDKFEYHTSRGCPYRCTFCSSVTNSNRTWRPKSAEIVLEELEYIVKKYNPRRFVFMDALFTANKKRVEEICKGIIEKGWSFEIYYLTRADLFSRYDHEFIKLMRRAGITEIAFGGESGSQRVLDFLKKDLKAEVILKATNLCKEHDIKPIFSFIVGIPTETNSELKQTLALYDKIKKVHPGAMANAIYIFTPIPGTPINDYLIENYNYQPPIELTQWTDWKWSAKENVPWISKGKLNELEGITIIARYKFVWDLLKDWSYKEKLGRHGSHSKVLASMFFNSLFYLPMKLRWKLRYFKYPLEFVAWERALQKFKGNA